MNFNHRSSVAGAVALGAVLAVGAAFGEVVDLNGADLKVTSAAAVNADGYTNSSATTATLTFDFADDISAPSIGGAIKFVKRGAGTVTFASAQTYTGGTIVSNGLIGVSSACNVAGIGSGGSITLAGGGLKFLTNSAHYTIDRSLVVAAGTTGIVDNVSGKTVNLRVDCVDFRNSVLYLKSGYFYNDRGPNYTYTWQSTGLALGGTYMVGKGATGDVSAGDTFGNGGHQTDITLWVKEGGKVYLGGGHDPLTPNVILEGGAEIYAADISKASSSARFIDKIITTAAWKSTDLNRRVTVIPGETQTTAKLSAQNVHLAPLAQDAVFDIREGTTFEVNSQLWPHHGESGRSLRKIGAGRLYLKRPLAIGGPLYVEEGTVELAPHVMLGDVSHVYVSDVAKLILGDGSIWNHALDPTRPGGFLASADVWFDATQVSANDGDSIARTPNLGMAGGMFSKFTSGSIPGAPTYDADGIGGKPALHFAGGLTTPGAQALVLTTYTNTTDHLTVYLVFKWDGWEDGNSNYYKWHGPVSFCNTSATGEDNNVPGAFDIQYGETFSTMNFYFGSAGASVPGFNGTPTSDNQLLFKVERSGTSAISGTWWSDANSNFKTATKTGISINHNINRVNLGGRLTSGGSANYHRMLKGWIGELIAFSRDLTEEERDYIESYLKRKWFASTTAAKAVPSSTLVRTLDVDVAEDGVGELSFGGIKSKINPDYVKLKANGPGTLDLVGPMDGFGMIAANGGTVRFNSPSNVVSEAAIWMDASDMDSIVTNAQGRVVSVVNKGNEGGKFVQCTNTSARTPLPLPALTNLNGLSALKVDWNSGLGIDCDPMSKQEGSAKFIVFAVLRRDDYITEGTGMWGGPFSFFLSTKAENQSDYTNDCGLHAEEPSATKVHVSGLMNGDYTYAIADGTPYMFTYYRMDRDASIGYETVRTEDTTSMSNVIWSLKVGASTDGNVAQTHDYLVLGGRLWGQKVVQWHGQNNKSNRMWNGTIAEFIAFDRQLASPKIAEVAAYLRKKWFNVGSGSATPPEWLGGAVATNGLDAALTVADGATVETSGEAVALKALSLEDGATLVRTDSVADIADFALFNVAGSVLLSGSQTLRTIVRFPKATSVKIANAGSVEGSGESWNLEGARNCKCGVVGRDDGLWMLPPGSVFLFW